MSKQPSYPEDAAVGDPSAEGGETLDAARRAKEATQSGEKGNKRPRNSAAGAAVGAGPAALVAALLSPNRSRRSDKGGSDPSSS